MTILEQQLYKQAEPSRAEAIPTMGAEVMTRFQHTVHCSRLRDDLPFFRLLRCPQVLYFMALRSYAAKLALPPPIPLSTK